MINPLVCPDCGYYRDTPGHAFVCESEHAPVDPDPVVEKGARALYALHPEEYRPPRHSGDAAHLQAVAVIDAVRPLLQAEVDRLRAGWDADVDFLNRMVEERDAARDEVGRLQDLIGGSEWRIAADVRAEVADEVEMRCQQIHHGAGDCPHCGPILRLIREAS